MPTTPLILTTPDGTYFDGRSTLTFLSPKGDVITWPLPSSATGRISPTLIPTPDGRLFLYNEPGRILRFRRNFSPHATNNQQPATSSPPFTLEATFTRRIPNAEHPTRIWLDPGGRIVIANDKQLSLLFPTGRIPRETALLIPASELDNQSD